MKLSFMILTSFSATHGFNTGTYQKERVDGLKYGTFQSRPRRSFASDENDILQNKQSFESNDWSQTLTQVERSYMENKAVEKW